MELGNNNTLRNDDAFYYVLNNYNGRYEIDYDMENDLSKIIIDGVVCEFDRDYIVSVYLIRMIENCETLFEKGLITEFQYNVASAKKYRMENKKEEMWSE